MSELDGVIAPFSNLILVLPEAEVKTKSGLVIAHSPSEKEQRRVGVVKAVGPGKLEIIDGREVRTPMDIQPGMRVMYSWNIGERHTINGVDYLVMRQSDLVGQVAEDAYIGIGYRP